MFLFFNSLKVLNFYFNKKSWKKISLISVVNKQLINLWLHSSLKIIQTQKYANMHISHIKIVSMRNCLLASNLLRLKTIKSLLFSAILWILNDKNDYSETFFIVKPMKPKKTDRFLPQNRRFCSTWHSYSNTITPA